MKLKYYLFTTGILAALFLAGCSWLNSTSSPAASSSGKTFTSEKLGVSFEYPADWSSEIFEDLVTEEAVIFAGTSTCSELTPCKGLLLTVRTKENYDYDYLSRLAGDFQLAEFASDMTKSYVSLFQPSGSSSAVSGRPFQQVAPFQKGGFLITQFFPHPEGSNGKNTLEIYNQKNRISIIEGLELTEEESRKIFDRIIETFQELPLLAASSTTGTSTPETVVPHSGTPEYVFDSCGSWDSFKETPFSSDFLQKISGLSAQRTVRGRLRDSSTVSEKKLKDVCYSSAGKMLIALVSNEEYCDFGGILKYSTDTGAMAWADDIAAHKTMRCASLTSIGKRKGKVIEVKGGFGDAGVSAEIWYHYDYVKNTLSLKRDCVTEYHETNGTKKTACHDY